MVVDCVSVEIQYFFPFRFLRGVDTEPYPKVQNL